jgi:small subunit ribosomal protein S17
MASVSRTRHKVLKGVAMADALDKTVKVLVERMVQDPTYKKYIRRRKKFLVHDEKSECRLGDKVEIIEARPISRNKSWRLLRVVEHGKGFVKEAVENDTN